VFSAQFVASKFQEISSAPNPMAALAVKCAEQIKVLLLPLNADFRFNGLFS
jgi:hypothetical protein